MVFNATFNNISVISWRSVLLMGETRIPGENRRPVVSHWQTLSITQCRIEYTSPWTVFKLTTLVVIGTDCIGSCISNYHTIPTITALSKTTGLCHPCHNNFAINIFKLALLRKHAPINLHITTEKITEMSRS